ncbi:35758b1c-b936-45c6-bc69-b9a63c2ae389 [Sclerotinia trifoliorum]|uniref:35758b1c-b936-45c6-bc69-b9a63c2ae389 n=1 Tax=Sclerotinia trifoliorum TaxID=28548 RepID=A0A8H2ZQI6_9HELO|nr:35758b1c-b936-45c6-bc69-b9a63c2ae389 [Sclerotinia trifoliorum]
MDFQQLTLPTCLDEAQIKSLPSKAFYVPDFLTEDEEQVLLQKIATAPKPRWKQLTHRRLQTWPSDLTKNTLLDAPLPVWLTDPVVSRLLSLPTSHKDEGRHIFSDSPHGCPTHVLINEYLPNQGIMPHKDGSAYHPVVCTVSLGASLCLDIYGDKEDGTREEQPRWRILQEPRSLLITTDELYTNYYHGISEIEADINLNSTTVANWNLLRSEDGIIDGRYERRERLSLTYRDVLKVSKLGTKLGIFGKR